MWIVKLALKNPYTIGVLSVFLILMGFMSLATMKVDIFPTIDMPVVAIVWSYDGMSAEDMERRIVFVAERGYSTTVNGITRIESRSIPGIGVIRIYFEPGTEIGTAIAQISSASASSMRIMPPAITPPNIIQSDATNVPVAQLMVDSETLPEEKIADYSQNFVRLRLFTLPGLSTPAPYGGKTRLIAVDVDPDRLYAKGLSPQDVVTALNNSNLIIPAGTARIGSFEYNIILNSSPDNVPQFANIPVKMVNGQPVLLGDVAHVADSYANQTNVVRVNGRRATYLNILKKSNASTLDVVDEVKKSLPTIQKDAPKAINFRIDFDQSVFVKDSISGVLREAGIAAVLVSTMILFFLGSWQSVMIVCTSIPLSIFASIIGLKLTGNTINIMTLGGLSLAIGMLVDDATVEVENIHRNIGKTDSLNLAILRGASQIALPAIMATLAICIVFFPVVLLQGAAKYLFTPLALSVVFSMLASYVLSRTLVPTLAEILLKKEIEHKDENGELDDSYQPRWIRAINRTREKYFTRFASGYENLLGSFMEQRFTVLIFFGLILAMTLILPFFVVGRDFFPTTDAGIMKLHLRLRSGTRIEKSELQVAQAENRIRALIPADELRTINSTIGIPMSYNIAFVDTDNIGPMDAEILVALAEKHRPTEEYMKKIRLDLAQNLPGAQIYFQPADIVNQVLNFGLSAPVDVQIEFQKMDVAEDLAKKIAEKMRGVAGVTDVNIKQIFDYPAIRVNVDRLRAARLGLDQKDTASSMLISLASSSLIAPNFFLNPDNNVSYLVVTKVPLREMATQNDLLQTPVTSMSGDLMQQTAGPQPATNEIPISQSQTLGNLATLTPFKMLNLVNHVNVQRVLDITSNVEDRDLGSTVKDIQAAIHSLGPLPEGCSLTIQGQNDIMTKSFTSLGLGMILAVVLVFLLMVVLFQSWLDPFIILTAVVGALIGILWMLALTHTTLNVESLMGSIMAIGIAVSNSILLVSFANDERVNDESIDSHEAAIRAGRTRLRPVLMTALAMVLGMIPMSLGLGEGGEQNAPLGRAVIGGLLMATMTTLLIVPVVYSILRKGMPQKHVIRARIYHDEQTFDQEQLELLEQEGVQHGGR